MFTELAANAQKMVHFFYDLKDDYRKMSAEKNAPLPQNNEQRTIAVHVRDFRTQSVWNRCYGSILCFVSFSMVVSGVASAANPLLFMLIVPISVAGLIMGHDLIVMGLNIRTGLQTFESKQKSFLGSVLGTNYAVVSVFGFKSFLADNATQIQQQMMQTLVEGTIFMKVAFDREIAARLAQRQAVDRKQNV